MRAVGTLYCAFDHMADEGTLVVEMCDHKFSNPTFLSHS